MLTVSDSVATSNPDVVNIYVGSLVPEATAPPAPTSLNSNPSDSTVVLSWQNPDDGGSPIIDYVVEYQSANSSWNTYDDGISPSTISIVRGLENNITYQFRISAVNSVGTSDSSSLISATPIPSTPVAETPVAETPVVPQPEPTVPEPEHGIASFVDQAKDPRHYIDRYNNEPAYKQWFDENYSQYDSIFQAVGLDESTVTVEPTVEPTVEKPEAVEEIVTAEFIEEPVDELEVTCGTGTIENKDGICILESSNGGGCLIATATYGSEMSQQVQQLRELRDNQLLQTKSGNTFMTIFNEFYYSFSPIIADYERENSYFKEAVKLAITPMISTLSLMENVESESEVLSIGISVIMLNIGMYFAVPAIVIIGLRKKF